MRACYAFGMCLVPLHNKQGNVLGAVVLNLIASRETAYYVRNKRDDDILSQVIDRFESKDGYLGCSILTSSAL
jgi:hypothetical protein